MSGGFYRLGTYYGVSLLLSIGLVTAKAEDPRATEQFARGEELYNQNCVFCHQPDAIGKPGIAPSLTNKELLSAASDEFFLKTIKGGRPGTGMAPFAHLSDDKIKDIIYYLRAHSESPDISAKIDSQPPAKGSAANGHLLFYQICSTCHGPDGDGYISGGTGTAIGKKGFLDRVSDGFIRTTIKNGRSNTRMRGFNGPNGLANLTDKEIDDIIVYLRSLAKEN